MNLSEVIQKMLLNSTIILLAWIDTITSLTDRLVQMITSKLRENYINFY